MGPRLIGLCHAHEPNFQVKCGVSQCNRGYSNYASFRRHLKRNHPEIFLNEFQPESTDSSLHTTNDADDHSNDQDTNAGTNDHESTAIENNQDSSLNSHQRALFLLKAREIHKISQQALSDVMTDFTVMIDDILDDVHGQVKKMLALTDGIPPANSVAELGRIFNDKK